MTHLYDELIEILEKEYSFCIALVELLKKEKEVIVRLNAADLEQLLREKETLTFKIKSCDEKRDNLLMQLGFQNKTIKEIAYTINGNYRKKLLNLAEEFSLVIQDIRDLNKINSMLIAKSLHYIKTSYNFLNTFNISPREKLSVEA
ncbi:MAG: flagellar protein FlgN [Thermodesulfovibrionales bacterium]|nr:flagellar protein FlgN [Thermodesulfovibrionales bacterium]